MFSERKLEKLKIENTKGVMLMIHKSSQVISRIEYLNENAVPFFAFSLI